ncbi:MAG TPA: isoprenylcysteine carboxylmethyltransferase family protein [Polyangiaceae bacterium]
MYQRYVIIAPWIVLGLVWLVAAPFSRKTIQSEGMRSRLSYVLPIVIAGALVFSRAAAAMFPWLQSRLWSGPAPYWIGVGIEYAGIAFALWARAHLGRLWSGTITVKEGHRLVTSGPFALARHPIYTGALVGALGVAIATGYVKALVAFALIAVGFSLKLTKEDELLSTRFGEEHRAYRKRVARLIPFVW